MRFLRGPSFPGSSPSSGCLGRRGGSVLAAEALVSGPPPAVAGPSSGPSRPSRPPVPASVSSALPGSPQATALCLETLRRFTRAAGFSSAVASQASLARRQSSRTNYQLKWSVYRSWCHSHGHSVSRPTLSKFADFLCWLRSSRGLSVFSIKGYHSMLSAVFRFHLPALSSILSSGTCFGLSGFRLQSVSYVLLLGICLWSSGSLTLRRSSLCLRLLFTLCRRRRCFCWPSLRPSVLGVAGSLQCCYLCGVRRLSLLCSSVCGQVGVAHPFHPSLLLGEVLVRFCGGSQ